MALLNIAVFASGQGTNFQAIIDAAASGELRARISLLVCDRPQAAAIERAERAGIEVFAFRPKQYASREAYETEIVKLLEERGIELVVLAGYMRLLTPVLTTPFYGKMINVHPSLLPAFPGIDAVGQAINYGVKLTGVTVHFVDDGLDTGPIIAQQAVEVLAEDTYEALLERVQQVERRLLPQVIGLFQAERIRLQDRTVTIKTM